MLKQLASKLGLKVKKMDVASAAASNYQREEEKAKIKRSIVADRWTPLTVGRRNNQLALGSKGIFARNYRRLDRDVTIMTSGTEGSPKTYSLHQKHPNKKKRLLTTAVRMYPISPHLMEKKKKKIQGRSALRCADKESVAVPLRRNNFRFIPVLLKKHTRGAHKCFIVRIQFGLPATLFLFALVVYQILLNGLMLNQCQG